MEYKSVEEDLNLKINELEEKIIKNKEDADIEINNLKILCNKHDECNQIIENLKENLKIKEKELYGKDIEIERLNYLTFQLNNENETLKDRMRQNEANMNFKEFVILKRDNARLISELNSLRNDKQNLNSLKATQNESNASIASPTCSPLPPLKESMIKKKPLKKN